MHWGLHVELIGLACTCTYYCLNGLVLHKIFLEWCRWWKSDVHVSEQELHIHNLSVKAITQSWWIWMNFSSINWKMQHSHSRHQKTTSNFLRITIEKAGWGSAMNNVHKPMVKLSGAPNELFLQILQNIWLFQTEQFTRLLETKPIRAIFHFQYLPKLYFGFKQTVS